MLAKVPCSVVLRMSLLSLLIQHAFYIFMREEEREKVRDGVVYQCVRKQQLVQELLLFLAAAIRCIPLCSCRMVLLLRLSPLLTCSPTFIVPFHLRCSPTAPGLLSCVDMAGKEWPHSMKHRPSSHRYMIHVCEIMMHIAPSLANWPGKQ